MTNQTAFAALVLACAFGANVRAQAASVVVPPVCAQLPGNAALALPLRWSHGTLQVFVDAQLLPANFAGQAITGVWLRRPTLLGDVAYAAIQRTLTVRGGFQPFPAAQMHGSVTANRPANTLVLFGPAPVSVAAAPAPGPATALGPDLLHVVFTTPLPVVAGTLFLEFETSNPPLQISTEHWVEGVWFGGGNDTGYAVTVGDGSCTTRAEPTLLQWTGSQGPLAGTAAAMQVTGAPPTAGSSTGFVLAWLGLDPQTRGPGAGYLGFGASLTAIDPTLTGCHQWAPFDASWFGATDAVGTFAATFPIPGTAAVGTRLAVQAAWLDPARAGLPLSFSNGLMLVVSSAGIGNHCGTMFFPAGATVSPWGLFLRQMPVLRLEY